MKHTKPIALFFGLLVFCCRQADAQTIPVKAEKIGSPTEKEQIQKLIRQVLHWSDSKTVINLLPVLTDSKINYYTGVNFKKHQLNLEKLKAANLFSAEFIENFNQIILTLDKKIKSKTYGQWQTGDLPPFNFSGYVNPWCLCQDVPYGKPSPWDFVSVNVSSFTNGRGAANWQWGKLELNTDPSWREFAYKFKFVKEKDKWKISYLEGFDFKKSTSKAGM